MIGTLNVPKRNASGPKNLFTPAPDSDLPVYTGTWEYRQAAHLLRRCLFGPTPDQIKWAVEQGLEATVDKLLDDIDLPDPPVNFNNKKDKYVAVGSSWVKAAYDPARQVEQMEYRERSLYGWTIGLMLSNEVSVREKLVLFWQNHFAINSILDPKFLYRYNHTLREYAWGNFRELVKAITIDPSMLIFLNGNRNSYEAPNENYARELLELYSIGKGPLVGPGDYTNYTEEDIKEIARVLTGWRDFGFTNDSGKTGEFGSKFQANRHDKDTKNLSYRFNNAVINNEGDKEYATLIDIIFQQPACARFICKKLYQWFVDYRVEENAYPEAIEPMAQVLIDNDYELKPALKALFMSDHFYQKRNLGLQIKNPFDFMLSVVKPLKVNVATQLDQQYDSWYRLYSLVRGMHMDYFDVPEVAGWEAYYREPLYYRLWVSASTLPPRTNLTHTFTGQGFFPFQANGPIMKVNMLDLVKTFNNPKNPNDLIDELANVLLPMPIADNQKLALKEVLIPGLPDFEWTVEYGDYVANPGDKELASAVESRLKELAKAILSMPEYYLS